MGLAAQTGTARGQERDARRRYQAALTAALESLRRAEELFDGSAAAIDAHIQRALTAADLLTTSLASGLGLERVTANTRSAAPGRPEEALA